MSLDSNLNIRIYSDLLKKILTASIYDQSSWSVVYMDPPEWRRDKNVFRLIRNHIKWNIIKWLKRRSLSIVKTTPLDFKAREAGNDWPNLMGFTMVGHRRLDNLEACIEDVLKNNVEGDFIETGAWRGGVTMYMRALLKAHGVTDRIVWVADSFEGLPVPASEEDGWDLSQVQMLKVSIEQVKENFKKLGLLDDQVRFLKGWFCDTLPIAPIGKLAILRLDGDMYSSTMDSLNNLYPKLSKGGYVIVDDYYSWTSCYQAVSDYLKLNGLVPDIRKIDDHAAYWKCE